MSLSPPSAPPKTFERALFAEDEENGIAESTEERRRVLNSSWETFRIRPRSGITSLATRADGEVLTTLHDDAPFLLDSILAYLNERGCVLKTIRHPILSVRRDSRGRALDVSNRRERSEGFRLESFIRIGISGATPAPEGLSLEISRIVADAADAAAGWKDMRERVALAAETLRDRGDSEEAAFLEWLLADRFIFLGVADYALRKGRLRLKPASGLGLLKDGRLKVLRRGARAVNDTPELRQFLSAPGSPLLATKANFRTRVHRRAHMDYISVKTFPTSGEKAVGELRIVGLLSAATRRLNPHAIPLVGDRLRRVENASSHAPDSHSGKSLRRALETCPLDEMFQMTDDDLRRYARRMASLHLRPRVGVSARRDRFDRYVSAIVAVPREKYDTQARLKIGELLAEAYAGRISFSRQIPTDGPLAHAHFIVAREREMKRDPSLAELSKRLAARLRAWEDDMIDALRLRGEDAEALRAEARDGNAFPPGYKARFTGDQAVEDLIRFRRDIPREGDEAARFAFRDGDDEDAARFIALRRGGASALSARLPILENMGLEAIYEDSFIIRLGAGDQKRFRAASRHSPRDSRASLRRTIVATRSRSSPPTRGRVSRRLSRILRRRSLQRSHSSRRTDVARGGGATNPRRVVEANLIHILGGSHDSSSQCPSRSGEDARRSLPNPLRAVRLAGRRFTLKTTPTQASGGANPKTIRPRSRRRRHPQ